MIDEKNNLTISINKYSNDIDEISDKKDELIDKQKEIEEQINIKKDKISEIGISYLDNQNEEDITQIWEDQPIKINQEDNLHLRNRGYSRTKKRDSK